MATPGANVDSLYDPYLTPAPSRSPPTFSNFFSRLSQWRTDLGLPNPGTVENLQKEVKSTHLTNYTFDGGRADLTKSLSANPLFQVSHSFTFGSQTAPPAYNLGAIFAHDTLFLHGGVDHDGNLTARLNQGWSASNISKIQAQIAQQAGHNLLQLEHDYQGLDYNLNAKVANPWPTDLTGVFVGSYLQSLTKNLALGFECAYQRPTPDVSEMQAIYLAKFTSSDKNCIATAQLQPSGGLQATYWQKLSDKVEVAGDLHVQATRAQRNAHVTLGAKYDLRMSTFRAQVDSTGKVSALLEQRFAPSFAFLVAGEIDHFKNSAKVGVGVMLDSSTLTQEEMMAAQMPQPPA